MTNSMPKDFYISITKNKNKPYRLRKRNDENKIVHVGYFRTPHEALENIDEKVGTTENKTYPMSSADPRSDFEFLLDTYVGVRRNSAMGGIKLAYDMADMYFENLYRVMSIFKPSFYKA